MISPEDAVAIRNLAFKLQNDRHMTLVVYTTQSVAAAGGAGLQIEQFSTQLFNRMGIGNAAWNYGILLVVSRDDRKARIEMGAAWAHRKDSQCITIMDEYIVPYCRDGKYSKGILCGVRALDKLARDENLPMSPATLDPLLVAGGILVASFMLLLFSKWFRSSSSYDSESHGPDSGFSGGGGATGSW